MGAMSAHLLLKSGTAVPEQQKCIFCAITCSALNHLLACWSLVTRAAMRMAGIMENGIALPWMNAHCAFITYESHVLFTLRFMVDCGIVGGGWVELPAGKYQVSACKLLAAGLCIVRKPSNGQRMQACVPD